MIKKGTIKTVEMTMHTLCAQWDYTPVTKLLLEAAREVEVVHTHRDLNQKTVLIQDHYIPLSQKLTMSFLRILPTLCDTLQCRSFCESLESLIIRYSQALINLLVRQI